MADFPAWVTKVVMRAKVVITKVRHATDSNMDMNEEGEARPSITQENGPIPSEVCMIGVEWCLRFFEDSIPLNVKEEA